jgi:integrase
VASSAGQRKYLKQAHAGRPGPHHAEYCGEGGAGAHASHLLAGGVNVKVVSARLGHASTSFTLNRYGHLMPGQDGDAATAVEAMVDGL